MTTRHDYMTERAETTRLDQTRPDQTRPSQLDQAVISSTSSSPRGKRRHWNFLRFCYPVCCRCISSRQRIHVVHVQVVNGWGLVDPSEDKLTSFSIIFDIKATHTLESGLPAMPAMLAMLATPALTVTVRDGVNSGQKLVIIALAHGSITQKECRALHKRQAPGRSVRGYADCL